MAIPNTNTTGSTAESLMKAYATAYTRQDIDGLLALFVDDGIIDIWGTGIDEHKTSIEGFRQTIRRDFREARTEITVRNLCSFVKGEAGVVMAEWLVRYQPAGQADWQDFPLVRASFYVEKQERNWRIRHAHWSSPLASQQEGYSFPAPL